MRLTLYSRSGHVFLINKPVEEYTGWIDAHPRSLGTNRDMSTDISRPLVFDLIYPYRGLSLDWHFRSRDIVYNYQLIPDDEIEPWFEQELC